MLDTAFEITRLIKFSPKRNTAFDQIKSRSEDDTYTILIGICTFCHTRWTVRGDAIESILVNYNTLGILWEECLQSPTRLDPDVKARIIGVQSQMSTFNLLFGLKLCERILKTTDNLSKTLQKSTLSAANAQHIASLKVTTLHKMRTDTEFQAFFASAESLCTSVGAGQPSLPRKRKCLDKLTMVVVTAEEHYRLQYFEAIDLAVESIKISQVIMCIVTLKSCYSREQLAVTTANISGKFQECITSLIAANWSQLSNLATYFQDNSVEVSLEECFKYLRSLSSAAKTFYSEVCMLALIMPATNAVSE